MLHNVRVLGFMHGKIGTGTPGDPSPIKSLKAPLDYFNGSLSIIRWARLSRRAAAHVRLDVETRSFPEDLHSVQTIQYNFLVMACHVHRYQFPSSCGTAIFFGEIFDRSSRRTTPVIIAFIQI